MKTLYFILTMLMISALLLPAYLTLKSTSFQIAVAQQQMAKHYPAAGK